MPTTYTFVLGEDDVMTFVGTLQYNEHDLVERNRKETDATEPEFEMNLEEIRVIKILLGQYEAQRTAGPVIGIDLRQDLAEPLQNALYTQLTYAQRQAARYLTMLATPGLPDAALGLINAEIKQYARQIEALEHVMRQIGRHV